MLSDKRNFDFKFLIIIEKLPKSYLLCKTFETKIKNVIVNRTLMILSMNSKKNSILLNHSFEIVLNNEFLNFINLLQKSNSFSIHC